MRALSLLPLLALGACATAAEPSGFLASYEGLKPREGGMRTAVTEMADAAALGAVKTVALEPTILGSAVRADWLSEAERTALLREVDAQLCFEITERYDLAAAGGAADARVRAAVTDVRPTGRAASAVSAAANFFIPGPVGLRAPGTTGALAAEAELLAPDGRQLAALTWRREAQPLGTDSPSLSQIGDALQFAEPFADDAGRVMSPAAAERRKIPDPDPCAPYGPRTRPAGFLTRMITGLYVPEASAAAPEQAAEPKPEAVTP